MLIIQRKRLIYITFVMMCSLSICYLGIKNMKQETVETVSIPVSNKVVIIDAGHGYPDEGAVRSRWINRKQY